MKFCHIVALTAVAAASSSTAQTTSSARDTVTAYGARLLDPADTSTNLNKRRINNRIENRIDNRIDNRIERYRVGDTGSPTAAFDRTNAAPTTQAYGQAAAEAQQIGRK